MSFKHIPIRRLLIWHKFDEYVNVTSSEIRSVLNSEEAKNISQTKEQAAKTSSGGLAGKDVSREIQHIIDKSSKFRGQLKNIPNFTEREWFVLGRMVAYIKRNFYGKGALEDADGNPLPRKLSLILWGFNPSRSGLPTKQEVKNDVVQFVKKQKEKEKKESKKLNEDFFKKYL